MTAKDFYEIITTIIVAILSSTGIWGYLEQKRKRLIQKSEQEQKDEENIKHLLLALTRAQICNLATQYIERGYITNTEADILEELFTPYHNLGGNGSGQILYEQAINLKRK